MNIIKRDGRNEDLNPSKVKVALEKANKSLENPISDEELNFIYDKIVHKLYSLTKDNIEIEEIQDIIVSYLKKYCKRLYKHYSTYRQDRAKIRDIKQNGKYYKTILELVNGISNDTSTENSNKDASQIHVIRDLVAGETSKKLYRENIMSPKLRELHDKGILHVHDCDYRLQKGITNCCVWNLKDILENGTVMNGKLIEKPHTLLKACNITTQVFSAIGSAQYGGQTVSITHLAPFIRESRKKYIEIVGEDNEVVDRLLDKEIKDSVQTLMYQLNTLSTTNGQSPFCTLFMYPKEDPEYYEETMILCKEILKQRIQGMKSPSGQWINPTFPKLVVMIYPEMFDESNTSDWEFTKLCSECVAKRMVPDFMSEKKGEEYKEGCHVPPMGCRAFLQPWKNEKGEYEVYGRSNFGVISLNLPYLALESNSEDEFFSKLDEMIDYVCNEQYKIYNEIINSSVEIAPILYKYGGLGRCTSGTIEQVAKNKRCTISLGYMGIAEVVERFGIHFNSKEGHDLGIQVIKHIKDKLDSNTNKYGIYIGLYATPAESLTTKFAKAIKQFPEIPHVNDRDYITNSYHIPVEEEIDAFSKIDFESEFQKYSTAG